MNIADVIYEEVRMLPEPLAREVLDFIGVLRERQDRDEWHGLMNAQASALVSVWESSEDSVWDDA